MHSDSGVHEQWLCLFWFFCENRPDDDQEDLYAKVEETLEQMPEEELMKFYKEYVNSSGKEMN